MLLINIDGPDGVGKSSVTEMLLDYFRGENLESSFLHFPRYRTPLGELIKDVLFNRTAMDPKSMQMLYSADRLNFTRYNLPNYEKHLNILIVDRYTTSALVHIRFNGGDPEDILSQEREVRKPDLNLILLARPEIAMGRMVNTGKELDLFENMHNQTQAFEFYSTIDRYADNVVYIDAEKPLQEVFADVLLAVNNLFKKG